MAFEKISVIYLTYDGLSDPLGQSQIMPYIEGLSKLNFQFTIISFEKANRLEKSKKEIEHWSNQYNIKWIPLQYHKQPPILSTIFDLWILWRTFKRIYKEEKFTIVHCRSYLTSLIGLKAKRKYDIKFIFDMRGFWADERVEGNLWNLNNPIYRRVYFYFKKKEREFLESADYVISLTHNAKKEIESWH